MSTSSANVGPSPNRDFENFPLSKPFLFLGQLLWKRHREYKVVEGDFSVWLAEKSRTPMKSIERLNNLQDDIIYTGSILKIERSAASKQQNLLGRKASPQERATSELGYKLDSSVTTFISVHPMFKVSRHAQQSRVLSPKTVKVQYGDTLADIASAHGLTVRELQHLNHLRDDVIFEGDVLAVKHGPSNTELVELRAGRRRTNRPLFSRQLHVGGPLSPPRTKPVMASGRGEAVSQTKSKFWLRFLCQSVEDCLDGHGTVLEPDDP